VPRKFTILVCRGPECGEKRHSANVHAQLRQELAACPLDGIEVNLDLFSCFGKCKKGVNVLVREVVPTDNPALLRLMPSAGSGGRAVIYHGVEPRETRRILEEHILGGRRIVEFVERGAQVERLFEERNAMASSAPPGNQQQGTAK
jgi:(2Fe-2S) ferredoxin